MSDRKKIIATLQADAERADGYVPSARTVTEPRGARLLQDPSVIEVSLAAARAEAGIEVVAKKTRKKRS